MRFYIATALKNVERAERVIETLVRNGHEQVYDWTEHGDIRCEGKGRMGEVAFNEIRAVRDAELVLVLLPGGFSTHVELGAAIASRSNKRIILWSETGDEFNCDENTVYFYYHSAIERVVCGFDRLLELLDTDRISAFDVV